MHFFKDNRVKRILFILTLLLLSFNALSQSVDSISVEPEKVADSSRRSGDAFGFRLGAGPDRSGEFDVTWQKKLGRYRLEVDLGWAQNDQWGYLNISTAFHFHWYIVKGLAWYVGPGVNLGWYFGDYHFGLGAGFQLGIEYNFSFPLQFSIDIFPRYNIFGAIDAVGLGGSGALSVRYLF